MATLLKDKKRAHQYIALLFAENKRLMDLKGKYQRNLRNNSSPEVLTGQSLQIRECERRIARLYAMIHSSR